MEEKMDRKQRYNDDFALTKFTLPVVWQISCVIPGGFFIYHDDEKMELIYASKKVLDIYGCSTLDEFKALTGYTFEGMVYPEDYPKIQAEIDNQIDSEEGDSMDHVEYRIKRLDGTIRWVDDFGHYSYSPEYGGVYYVFINDITERKLLESEYKESSESFENLARDCAQLLKSIDKKTIDPGDETEELLESLKARVEASGGTVDEGGTEEST